MLLCQMALRQLQPVLFEHFKFINVFQTGSTAIELASYNLAIGEYLAATMACKVAQTQDPLHWYKGLQHNGLLSACFLCPQKDQGIGHLDKTPLCRLLYSAVPSLSGHSYGAPQPTATRPQISSSHSNGASSHNGTCKCLLSHLWVSTRTQLCHGSAAFLSGPWFIGEPLLPACIDRTCRP